MKWQKTCLNILILLNVLCATSFNLFRGNTVFADEKIQLVSSFNTSILSSSLERKHNVALATSSFCWLNIEPQEKLSFNETVGERTLENGYKNAKVIKDGEYVEGVGGGVCQVSSTLYNAWIRAGLYVESVKGHSLPTSYCELSQDATVSRWIDLVLVNDSFATVYVNGRIYQDTIIFDIYGVKPLYDIKVRSELIKTLEPKEKIEYVTQLDSGKVFEEVRKGKIGYVSRAYLEYYEKDMLVKEELIRQDYYLPVSRIVRVVGCQEESIKIKD